MLHEQARHLFPKRRLLCLSFSPRIDMSPRPHLFLRTEMAVYPGPYEPCVLYDSLVAAYERMQRYIELLQQQLPRNEIDLALTAHPLEVFLIELDEEEEIVFKEGEDIGFPKTVTGYLRYAYGTWYLLFPYDEELLDIPLS